MLSAAVRTCIKNADACNYPRLAESVCARDGYILMCAHKKLIFSCSVSKRYGLLSVSNTLIK